MKDEWSEFDKFLDDDEIIETELCEEDLIETVAETHVKNPSMSVMEIALQLGVGADEVKTILVRKETRHLLKNIKYSYTDELVEARNAAVNLLKRVLLDKDNSYPLKDRINVAKFVAKNIVERDDGGEEDELIFITEISGSTGALTKSMKKMKDGVEI